MLYSQILRLSSELIPFQNSICFSKIVTIKFNRKMMKYIQFFFQFWSEFSTRSYKFLRVIKEIINILMHYKIICLFLCIISLIFSQNLKPPEIENLATPFADRSGFSSSRLALPSPWLWWRRCCNTHNIFVVDNSGSMIGTPWSKAQAFVSSLWGSSDYVSFFTFNSSIKSYYLHELRPYLSWPSSPNGGTNFNNALNQVSFILRKNYPDRTCIYFISDGYFTVSNYTFTTFVNALGRYKSKTGCPVCIKCIEAKWTNNSQTNPTFKAFCDKIKADYSIAGAITVKHANQFIKRQSFKLNDLLKQQVFSKDYKEWEKSLKFTKGLAFQETYINKN